MKTPMTDNERKLIEEIQWWQMHCLTHRHGYLDDDGDFVWMDGEDWCLQAIIANEEQAKRQGEAEDVALWSYMRAACLEWLHEQAIEENALREAARA